MNFYIIPAALIVTVILIILISIFSKRPLSGLWLFFLVIFLATWSSQLWINPFGPKAFGVSWLTLFAVAIFFSVLILALTPPVQDTTELEEPKLEDSPFMITGMFFWMMMMLLVISIAVGYYRSPILT